MDLAVLDLGMGPARVLPEPTEEDILANVVEGIDYAALAVAPHRYIDCAASEEVPGGYWLGYCDDQAEGRWHAADGPMGLDAVLSAFRRYLRGDRSWRLDFRWAKLDDADA